MPHDSHTTHEPDRVGREGDEFVPSPDAADDIHRQPTLLMFGSFPSPERELSPAIS